MFDKKCNWNKNTKCPFNSIINGLLRIQVRSTGMQKTIKWDGWEICLAVTLWENWMIFCWFCKCASFASMSNMTLSVLQSLVILESILQWRWQWASLGQLGHLLLNTSLRKMCHNSTWFEVPRRASLFLNMSQFEMANSRNKKALNRVFSSLQWLSWVWLATLSLCSFFTLQALTWRLY